MKTVDFLYLVGFLVVFYFGPAHPGFAERYDASGNWSVLVNVYGYNNQPFSGSATFSYDTSPITGVGEEKITAISLTSFSMSPATIGNTTFDVHNTAAHLEFLAGKLYRLYVGSALQGPDSIPSVGGYDDFAVAYFPTFDAASFGISLESFGGATLIGNTNGRFTQVLSIIPEPSSLILAAIAAIGLMVRVR